MAHKDKSCGTTTIYRLSDRVPGVNDREWHATKPAGTVANSTTAIGRDFRLTHDFSLPTTTVSVNTNINLNDTNNTPQELDIQVVDTVITVPEGGVWIQYAGGSEGYWAIEVGYCCGPLQLMAELGYSDREDNQSIVGPVFLPEGQHAWRGWNIDTGGTNSSHSAQYSLDGTTFTAAIPAGVEFNLEKRVVECQIIQECDPVPEGWQVEQFKDCVPVVVDPLPTPPAGLDEAAVLALVGPHPEQEICTGDFVDVSSRTGWMHTWTPTYTANSGTIIEDWVQIGTAETAPNCATDITVNANMGMAYSQLRNANMRAWWDVRLLVNGAAVTTYTFQTYLYEDDIGNTNLDDDIQTIGEAHFARASVPAGATITVEIRRRHNFVVGGAAIAAPFARVISGLRAHFNVHYSPIAIVTGRQ